jgi:N-acetylmuramoyl-L-alanine amidase
MEDDLAMPIRLRLKEILEERGNKPAGTRPQNEYST